MENYKNISFGSNIDVNIHSTLDRINEKFGTAFCKSGCKKIESGGEIWYEFFIPDNLDINNLLDFSKVYTDTQIILE